MREMNPQMENVKVIPQSNGAIDSTAKDLPEIEIFRVANGKLAEQWEVLDSWDANAQLGLFDPDRWPESVCGTGQKR